MYDHAGFSWSYAKSVYPALRPTMSSRICVWSLLGVLQAAKFASFPVPPRRLSIRALPTFPAQDSTDDCCYDPHAAACWASADGTGSVQGEWCDFSGVIPRLHGTYFADSADCSTAGVPYTTLAGVAPGFTRDRLSFHGSAPFRAMRDPRDRGSLHWRRLGRLLTLRALQHRRKLVIHSSRLRAHHIRVRAGRGAPAYACARAGPCQPAGAR